MSHCRVDHGTGGVPDVGSDAVPFDERDDGFVRYVDCAVLNGDGFARGGHLSVLVLCHEASGELGYGVSSGESDLARGSRTREVYRGCQALTSDCRVSGESNRELWRTEVRRTKEDRTGTGFKLALVLAPFLLVVVLGMIEWWMRSRGP